MIIEPNIKNYFFDSKEGLTVTKCHFEYYFTEAQKKAIRQILLLTKGLTVKFLRQFKLKDLQIYLAKLQANQDAT